MYKHIYISLGLGICLALASCKVPAITQLTANTAVPQAYGTAGTDSTNMGRLPWRTFFTDKNLVNLIDTALKNNQELMITFQEIQMAQNDIRAKHGSLLPTVGLRANAGVDKVGRYTSQGAGD
uniref:TolC family protein n=1 Tax=Mucilaginibacter sp. TaxID=1882438 RepID=UPI0035BC81F9